MAQERRTSKRLNVKLKAKILVQMFGSGSRYEYVTENISLTGLLLKSQAKPVQYNEGTLLEVWLYPNEVDEIYFFAKFVRKADDYTFALKITDISEENQLLLRKCYDDQLATDQAKE